MSDFSTLSDETLVTEIGRCRELAARSPDDYPMNNRGAWAIAARQAKDTLSGLEKEYLERLQGRSVTVVLVGEPEAQAAFRQYAETHATILTADVTGLYQDIAHKVLPSIGSDRTWNTSQHGLAIQYALNKAVDLGFQELVHNTSLPYVANVVQSMDDCTQLVRSVITTRLGHEIPRAYVRKELIERSAGLKPGGKTLGVVILGAEESEEATALLQAWPGKASKVVRLDHVPTEDEVIQTFRSLQRGAKAEEADADEQTAADASQDDQQANGDVTEDESSQVTKEPAQPASQRKATKKHR